MSEKNPYAVIKHLHVSEKASMLGSLKDSKSNKCIKKFELPKYVFVVDRDANKKEIAQALEEIYKKNKIRVLSVNTINVKPERARIRGRMGIKKGFKKAVVTLEKGDTLD